MSIKIKSQVSYKDDNFIIFIENKTINDDEKLAEFIFLSNFIITSLLNWSKTPFSLNHSNYSNKMIKGLSDFLNKNFNYDKNFIKVNEAIKGKRISIDMNDEYCVVRSRGFNIFGSQSNAFYYGLNAIFVLISYFLKKRKNDKDYFESMKKLIQLCIWSYFNTKINIDNKSFIATGLAELSLEEE